MTPELKNPPPAKLSTGVPGLDDVLCGGLAPGHLYLIEGDPGAGKTTLALQFLMEGVRKGESVLYLTLAESGLELAAVAGSHGWNIAGVPVHEIISYANMLEANEQYTMFHPSEVEMGETVQNILAVVREKKPTRVVLDSLSELQLLADAPLRYRRQVLALKQFFASQRATALFLDDRTGQAGDMQVHSIAHGVLTLEQDTKDYGAERRRMRVAKYRGVAYRGGYHDYKIVHGGLTVYPRLVALATRNMQKRLQVKSGLAALDQLLGGGMEQGSSTLISGPPGSGKSTLAAQFTAAALARGEKAAMFLFEESAGNLINRSDSLKMNLRGGLDDGRLTLQQIDPAELSPGEFAHTVCAAAAAGAGVVVIDSLNGYLNAMPDERFLVTHLHEMLTFLGQHGVVTILVGVQSGMMGPMVATVDASYLADNVLMLRYFEAGGEVRQAVSVFKKRGSIHERTIRAFCIGSGGVEVGPVLRQFRGVLTGVPRPVAAVQAEEGWKAAHLER